MANIFTNSPSDYTRDYNIVRTYVEDNAKYIAINTGVDIEEARKFILEEISERGNTPLHNREILYLEREKPGVRKSKEGTFLGYLKEIVDKQHIMVPTMTAYLNIDTKKSLLGTYIEHNMKMRKKHKKNMFVASLNGDKELESFEDVMQSSSKIKNNSLSGAHQSNGTVLFNKSAHPTLTSTCRCASGYGNANNEKFLGGNRHYWSPEVTIANILSIINKTDMDLLTKAMEEFHIHYPDAQEALDCVLYSSRLYWTRPDDEQIIYRLFKKMSAIERAAFVYVGDLFHLAKYNDALVRGLIGKLAEPATHPHPDPDTVFAQSSSDYSALANLLCTDITRGKTRDKLKATDPHGYGIVAQTIVNTVNTLESYRSLIRAMWVTKNVPASIYHLPNSIRRVVLVSDTDSTIFTNQYWTEWFVGKLDFTEQSLRVSYVTTFLTSQVVIHLLATMSGNMGVHRSQINILSMKNEYFFPVFVTTSMAKHYYAYMSAREGNVYEKMKLEIKGKNLRDSTLPRYIKDGVREYVTRVMDGIMAKGQLSIGEILGPIAEIETQIVRNVRSGGFNDMSMMSIKELSVYTNPESNPFFYHRMWETVFAPKYGEIEPPPYRGYKITVDLENPTKFKWWLDELADRDLAERMREFMIANKKNNIGMFVLPEQIANLKGIPEEMISGVNLRKLVYGTTFPYYMLLESLGLYITGSNLYRLVMDYYPVDHSIRL